MSADRITIDEQIAAVDRDVARKARWLAANPDAPADDVARMLRAHAEMEAARTTLELVASLKLRGPDAVQVADGIECLRALLDDGPLPTRPAQGTFLTEGPHSGRNR
jgi:hypothetical protein